MSITSPALNASREYMARTSSGYLMLLLLVVLAAVGFLAVQARGGIALLLLGVCAILFILILKGFYMLQPNQAAVLTLFGSYHGTDRATGLRWVWPWLGKQKLSTRANNIISETIKVNDLRGNPIEMAAQVVWRVTDTAQAPVRRRGLQGIRQGSDRGGGPHHRVALSVRRLRASRGQPSWQP